MSTIKKKKYLISLAGLIIVAVAVLIATGTISFHKKTGTVRPISRPITSLPAQPMPQKNPANSGSTIQQGGNVKSNNSNVTNNSSLWSTSSSGLLTVKSPTENTTFHSGDLLAGTASSGPVYYRLTDNQVGVIAQGNVALSDGNFSTGIGFKPYSGSGRLDVFNADANGKEINEVQINVNF